MAPSDVVLCKRSRRIQVGGRVVESAERALWLADAFTSLPVELEAQATPIVGDLVVISGRMRDGVLTRGRIEERQAPRAAGAADEHRRLLWQNVGSRLRARATALQVIRRYFERHAFVEVDTPLRVPSPGLDVHLEAIEASGKYLITSPEYHMKRLLAGGMPRIYQLAHATRADEAGTLHEPEFMMLEWYRAFSDSDAVMADTERLVSKVVQALRGRRKLELAGRTISVKPPFERLTVREAFRRHAGIDDAVTLAGADEDRFFELLVGQVEPALAAYDHPVFLCEYPLSQASLARPLPSDPSVAERFELYIAGVELCNGFGELTDPEVQRARFEQDRAERTRRGKPLYPIDENLLSALSSGMPRSSGNALGVDRLVMLATGATTIADVQPFPAERI